MLVRLLTRARTAFGHPSRAALALPVAVVLGGGLVLVTLVLLVSAWEERNQQRVAATRLVDDALAVRAADLATRARDHADSLMQPDPGSQPSRVEAEPATRLHHAAGIDLALVIGVRGRIVDAAPGNERGVAPAGMVVQEGLGALLREAGDQGRARPAVGFVRARGMPALLAVAPIDRRPGLAPAGRGPASLLVLGQTLDPAFLAAFGGRYHLDDLRLVAADRADLPVSLALRTADGRILGRLTWAFDSPLGRLLHIAAPLLLTTLLGLVVLAFLVARQTHAAAARIALTERLAFHDPLTGLPNRRLFLDRLEAALAERGAVLPVAILYLDLDGFKPVNDSLGHVTGDRLLQVVAGRLLDSVRASDTVARLGGDEFAILLPHPQRPEEAGEVARRLAASFADPILVEDRSVEIGVSIGAASAPRDGATAEMLLREADAAMYRMKAAGRRQRARHRDPSTSIAA